MTIRVFLTALCLVTLCACKGVTDSTARTIEMGGRSAKPLEIISLAIAETELKSAQYTARLGGQPVTLQRNGPHELLLVTPDILPGRYRLEFKIGRQPYRGEVQVSAGVSVSDPIAYVEGFVAETMGDSTSALTPELEAALVRFAALSPEQKVLAARTIANNRAPLDSLQNEIEAYHALGGVDGALALGDARARLQGLGRCDAWCRLAQVLKVVAVGLVVVEATPVIAVGVAVATAIDVGLSVIAGRRSVLVDKLKSVARELVDLVYWPHIKAFDLTLDNARLQLLGRPAESAGSRTMSAAALELNAGTAYQLYVPGIPHRSIRATDANGPHALVRELVPLYDRLRRVSEERLGVSLPPYSDRVANVPLERLDQIQFTVNGGAVRIARIEQREDYYLVSFEFVDPANVDGKDFDLDVSYTSGSFSHRNSIALSLARSLYGWYVGQYTLAQWAPGRDNALNSCGPQSGQTGALRAYIVPDARGVVAIWYMDSILANIPSLYVKQRVSSTPFVAAGVYSASGVRWITTTYTRPDGTPRHAAFHLASTQIKPGQSTASSGTPSSIFYQNAGGSPDCRYDDWHYAYTASSTTTFTGSAKPSDVSQTIIDQLLADPNDAVTLEQ